MDRKIVIVNAEKMDYDHRLDFSAMGAGAEIYPDSTPQEILDTDLYFIDRIGLRANLSPTRSNGLVAMIKQMRLYALAFAEEQKHNLA